MKVFVAGGSGQLGRELRATAPASLRIEAPARTELSIVDRPATVAAIAASLPDLIVNAAAYTAVDQAETDREGAFAVNAEGAANLAEGAAAVSARLIHVSTDFVFDGEKGGPYLPDDPPRPIGAYGESKLAGEVAVRQTLPHSSLVIRTSWLYSAHGRNFVTTMLRLFEERREVCVVADQIGCPTWARDLAEAIWRWSILPTASGIRHFSDAGVASWYDFATAIHERALGLGLLSGPAAESIVKPIPGEAYPTPARRPASSVLSSFASWKELEMTPIHWRAALSAMLAELEGRPHA